MQLDTVTGLYYDNARWYDATNSVFVSQDPIGFNDGGTNLVMYCANSPTNYVDTSGEMPAVGGMPRQNNAGATALDGLLRAAGGVFTLAAGIATAETGIGAFVAFKGADNIFTGLAQAFSGQPVPTLTSRIVGPNADAVLDIATAFLGSPAPEINLLGKLVGGGYGAAIASTASTAYKEVKALGAALEVYSKAHSPGVGISHATGGGSGGASDKPVNGDPNDPVTGGLDKLTVQNTPPVRRAPADPNLARKIADGHSYDKHVIKQKEYPGVTSKPQFQKVVQETIDNPSAEKPLKNGRYGWWNDSSGTVVIYDPNSPDGGTAFRPTAGKSYYDNLK
jgi:filamentous hemagglutinin